ncbi:hypothetical protein BMS3Abin01_00076 [bacterium BMS3Abin01]|nr:hypothetical protein BMS3Abin01_00076 [bacterium BMS3Abin01]
MLSLAAILLFVLFITLPYSNQAFHIDDAVFLDFAEKNLEQPFSQHVDDYHMMGEDFGVWRDTHPPVNSLYIALVMYLTGGDSEQPLHIAYIIFPLVAGISMYFLARRFTGYPLPAALLLLATPVVMVMSHNLMADVPMMAFWLAATALYIYGVDRDDTLLLALSAAAVTVAIFTGYQALALLVLLPAYPLSTGRLSRKNSLPFLLPAVAFALFSLINISQYGELPRFSHAGGTSLSAQHVLDRTQGMLLQTGGVSVFPLIMIAVFSFNRWRAVLLAAAVTAATALGIHHYRSDDFTGAASLVYIILLTASLMLLAIVVSESTKQLIKAVRHRTVDTDFLFLALWFTVMLAGTLILLPHATAKYMLPFLAPVVLVVFRELGSLPVTAGWKKTAAVAAVVLTFLAGTSISIADYQLAGSYRDFAADFSGRYQTSGTVWFIGEWGFRHYMEAEGYKYLSSGNEEVATGDIIVSPGVADWPLAETVSSRMQPVETIEAHSGFPVRILGRQADAGFYGTYWGTMPFAISRTPVEIFQVFVVGPRPAS